MVHLLTMEEAASLNPLDTALVAVGFTTAQARTLMENDFVDYDSFKLINKKDVIMVADSYGKRPTVAERIQFGSARLNRLVGLMHLDTHSNSLGIGKLSPDSINIRQSMESKYSNARMFSGLHRQHECSRSI